MPRDLLGHELTDTEAQLTRLYGELKTLAGREDLPPCVTHNVRKALACMWQVVTDLNLEFEQIYDAGA